MINDVIAIPEKIPLADAISIVTSMVNMLMFVVTLVYVIFTRGIFTQTKLATDEVIRQRLERDRPRIVVFPCISEGSQLISIEICNIGSKPAEDLTLRLEQEIYRWSHKNDTSLLNSLPAFSDTIHYFSVGQRLRFEFDTIAYLNDPDRPKHFGIVATYHSDNRTFTETQKIDFGPITGSSFLHHPLHRDIEKLNEKADVLINKIS